MAYLGSSGAIRIIGFRAAGKTTFLGTLAYLSNLELQKPIKSLRPSNPNARDLREQAEDILNQGLMFGPTLARAGDDSLIYEFKLEVMPSFWQKPRSFSLVCGDSAGEYFETLTTNPDRDFLDDCINALGLLVLIDGTNTRDLDIQYVRAFEVLKNEISVHSQPGYIYRIAIAFSKADRPKIWNTLHDLEGFFARTYPRSHDLLKEWGNEDSFDVDYFAFSAFGMMGDKSFEPNVIADSRHGSIGRIRNPRVWKPFGLVAPLYWLTTGKKDYRLQGVNISSNTGVRKWIAISASTLLSILGIIGAWVFLTPKTDRLTKEVDPLDICQRSWSDEEQQLARLQELFELNPDYASRECRRMLDKLLLSTGLEQASQKNLVPLAVERFCRISEVSDEETRRIARTFIERWVEDEYWSSIVKRQLVEKKDCPVLQPQL